MKRLICVFLLISVCAMAQTLFPNVAAGGVSYKPGDGSPIAGTGLYARLVSAESGTYSFSVVDAVPTSYKPFSVSTQVSTGIAQRVLSIGGVGVFVPGAAGVAWNGDHVGWSWTTGAMATVPIGKDKAWFLMPNARLVKSSVNNNSGYQVIVGFMIGKGWGK